eukprot:258591-Alexandrium_andersonii.AAC.1
MPGPKRWKSGWSKLAASKKALRASFRAFQNLPLPYGARRNLWTHSVAMTGPSTEATVRIMLVYKLLRRWGGSRKNTTRRPTPLAKY